MRRIQKQVKPLIGLLMTKTAINTYVVFIGNGLSAFFAFIFTVTAFRMMTIEDFGYFSAMLSFLLLISDVSDVGLGSSLSTFLPSLENQKQKLLSFLKTAFFYQTIIAIFVTIILWSISPILSDIFFHNQSYVFLIRVGIVGILCSIFTAFFQNSLSARQKFFQVSILSVFGSLLRVIFLLILIYFSLVNLKNVAWLQVLALFFTGLLAFIFLKWDFLFAERIKSDLSKLIKFSSFLGLARGFTAIASRLDVLMLVSLAGPVEAGIYSTASRVISIYPLLSGSFSTVIAPKISTIQSKADIHRFSYKVIFATLGIIVTIAVLYIIAEPFMIILFSEKARPAVEVFQMLLMAMIFFVASIPAVSLSIYYLRKPQILSINSILQLIIVVVANFYFIPKYGRLGPAYALILSYGITLLTTVILSFYFLKKKHDQEQ